uniref:Photolyase/cryptochrome alpha/beta domain-containing protein n=1 Tax=Ananas comosus var. bracteatus TaxID=296719 RepID=A0A6V7P625_ANACO|nr:unnamed protein product [Ananas comosus var. bracteatus]
MPPSGPAPARRRVGGGRSVVWFRRDLRVEDNPALAAGVRAGGGGGVRVGAGRGGDLLPGPRLPLVALPEPPPPRLLPPHPRRPAPHQALRDTVSALRDVVRATRATNLFFNHLYDPLSLVRDHRVKELLSAEGVTVRSFNADLLYEPWEINDENGHPFTTFASFWNKCLSMPNDPAAPLLPPKRINSGDISRCPSDNLVLKMTLKREAMLF